MAKRKNKMNDTTLKIKTVTAVELSFLFGLIVLVFWLSGSHGHIRFRPQMAQDWIITGLLVLFWAVPAFFKIYFGHVPQRVSPTESE
jgi:hypothetical protein